MSIETSPKMGRPPIYSPELADKVCLLIAKGASVNGIGRMEGMPCADTIYTWLYREKDFAERYAQAREAQTEVFAQEMMELADDAGLTPERINKAKLQIDTRKWIAAKLKPKKYGDSTILRGDKDNPLDLGLAKLLDVAGTLRKELPIIDGEATAIDAMPAIEDNT